MRWRQPIYHLVTPLTPYHSNMAMARWSRAGVAAVCMVRVRGWADSVRTVLSVLSGCVREEDGGRLTAWQPPQSSPLLSTSLTGQLQAAAQHINNLPHPTQTDRQQTDRTSLTAMSDHSLLSSVFSVFHSGPATLSPLRWDVRRGQLVILWCNTRNVEQWSVYQPSLPIST